MLIGTKREKKVEHCSLTILSLHKNCVSVLTDTDTETDRLMKTEPRGTDETDRQRHRQTRQSKSNGKIGKFKKMKKK